MTAALPRRRSASPESLERLVDAVAAGDEESGLPTADLAALCGWGRRYTAIVLAAAEQMGLVQRIPHAGRRPGGGFTYYTWRLL